MGCWWWSWELPSSEGWKGSLVTAIVTDVWGWLSVHDVARRSEEEEVPGMGNKVEMTRFKLSEVTSRSAMSVVRQGS